MKAVEWRNSITHKTGHLPASLLDSAVEEGISKVLELTALLASNTRQITASPEIRGITNFLQQKHGGAAPSIWVFPKHRLFVEFTMFGLPLREPEDLNKLKALVADFILKRKEQDSRFVAEEHLFISFFEFPRQMRARWHRGTLKLIDSDHSP